MPSKSRSAHHPVDMPARSARKDGVSAFSKRPAGNDSQFIIRRSQCIFITYGQLLSLAGKWNRYYKHRQTGLNFKLINRVTRNLSENEKHYLYPKILSLQAENKTIWLNMLFYQKKSAKSKSVVLILGSISFLLFSLPSYSQTIFRDSGEKEDPATLQKMYTQAFEIADSLSQKNHVVSTVKILTCFLTVVLTIFTGQDPNG